MACFMISMLLLVAERGSAPLPCISASKALQPCEAVKAATAAVLGFSPALPGAMGAALLALLQACRMSLRPSARKGSLLGILIKSGLVMALLFSTYLFWVQATAKAWCPWCLALGAFFLLALLLEKSSARAPRLNSGITGFLVQAPLFGLLIAAAITLPATSSRAFRSEMEKSLTDFIDPEILRDIAPCGFSDKHPRIKDQAKWDAPFSRGPRSAPVHLAVFYDPFCALCRQLDHDLQPIFEKQSNRLRVLSLPIPHVGDSREATRFLYAASRIKLAPSEIARINEAFHSLIDEPRRKTDREALAALLESRGIDTRPLLAEIARGGVDDAIERSLKQFRAAGGTKTPMLIINGQVISENVSSLRSPCLERLLEAASKGLQ